MTLKQILQELVDASDDGWVSIHLIYNHPYMYDFHRSQLVMFYQHTGAIAFHKDGMVVYEKRNFVFS